ncbi:MAG: ATP-binding protein [Lachnospiraceae bacterium]|nr:ATP-binding protein [Lachnospiraceae bacterium]
MINKFSCHNFRNVKADGLEFEKINLLIGPNNSGKSNFIKALTFFSEMLKNADDGNLKSAFLNTVARNGWDHSLCKSAQETEPIEFTWEMMIDEKPFEYKLSFGVGKTVEQCNIVLEELNSAERLENYEQQFNYFCCHSEKIGLGKVSTAIRKGQKNRRLNFAIDSKETIVMQFKDILLNNRDIYGSERIRVDIARILYQLQKYFEGFRVYTSVGLDTNRMRNPAELNCTDEFLNDSASNFTNVFNKYKAEDIFWKDLFEERMKDLIPNLKTADIVTAYNKLIFKLIFNDEQYDLSDVSEGTLKGLVLNMLINMPMGDDGSLLAIDEPETNLHPAWQKVVGHWIQTSGNYKQFFISTHSPDFLDVFTEEFKYGNVAVFVFDDGERIKKIQYQDIADELGDWELGDLYRTNDPALGGWPW